METTIKIGMVVFDEPGRLTSQQYSFYTVHLHIRPNEKVVVDTAHGIKEARFVQYGEYRPAINRWILGTSEELRARIIGEANIRLYRVTFENMADAYDSIPQAALHAYFQKC
jgi:hypothetical protein